MDHASPDPGQGTRDEILENHRRLGRVLVRLEHAAMPADLAPVLMEFDVVLRRHFAQEEGPQGLFAIVRTRAPHRREEARALEAEHHRLIADLGELVRRARERPDNARILGEAARFSMRVRQHERSETKLLIDALSG